ncbi:MAG: DEAD/DEAH box helicase family protein, partial [Candidatus Hydrogenedens sp.]
MKIGDISEWIKNKLSGYEIVERFENESIFKNINNSQEINILMGSRSFYEGWDSNRPNIILFINIGKGTDARKFVLQAVGRGVRIEPIKDKRKRAVFLYNNKELDAQIFDAIKDSIEPLESLFVYGTKSENLKEVIETLKQEKPEALLGDLFEINPDVKDKLLLIPVYRESNNIIVEEQDVVKFSIHPNDYELTRAYFNYLGDKICLVKYDCNIKVLQKLKEAFNVKKDNYFLINNEEKVVNNPEFLLGRIFKHFASKAKEFNTFKKLEEEIIHFKRINVSIDKLNHLREKIEKVKKAKDKELIKQQLKEKLEKKEINIDEYTKNIEDVSTNLLKEAETAYSPQEKIKIKYLTNHYYLPIALSDAERADFIQHIIKHKSEVDFINELENYLQQENNLFKNFDWWYFSKIDETLDEVYIPYYQPKTNRIEKFKPDFIFWLKKGNQYFILFVDPKGTEHTDGYRKIDGYSRIFETEEDGQKKGKDFSFDGFTINVKLLLIPAQGGMASVLEPQKKYWVCNFDDFVNKIQLKGPAHLVEKLNDRK